MNRVMISLRIIELIVAFGSILGFNHVLSAINIDCIDSYECQDETFIDDDDTSTSSCDGYYSCDNSIIELEHCSFTGANAANEAQIDCNTIESFGYRSLARASVSANDLLAYGYWSVQYSNITATASTNELNIELFGYLAGYGANILCFEGETCRIECGSGGGCYNVAFFCYSRATCYYNCKDDPSNCPMLFGGIGSNIIALSDAFDASELSETDENEQNVKNRENSDQMGDEGMIGHFTKTVKSFGIGSDSSHAISQENDVINNANRLHPESRSGLTDSEIDEIRDERDRIIEEKLINEKEMGVIDSDLIEKTKEYMKHVSKEGKNRKIVSDLPPELMSVLYDSDGKYDKNENDMDLGGIDDEKVDYGELLMYGLFFVSGAVTILIGEAVYSHCRTDSRSAEKINSDYVGYQTF